MRSSPIRSRSISSTVTHSLTRSRRLGLEQLVPQLDETDHWDRSLSDDEELRLSFTRVLLQSPTWLVIDELFDGLDERQLEPHARALQVGTIPHRGDSYRHRQLQASCDVSEVLHLVSDPSARALPSTWPPPPSRCGSVFEETVIDLERRSFHARAAGCGERERACCPAG